MTTSMFGTSLATPAERRESLLGPLNGTAARAVLRMIAEHHAMPVADVRKVLAPLFPRARAHLFTAAGWTLLAEYVGHDLASPAPMAVAIH